MLQLHIAILLFGLAGIFGKLLAIPATSIVLGRTAVAAAALYFLARRSGTRWTTRGLLKLLPSGALLALHWFTFFHAIQISTVAIGLLSFATFPVFVAFLDPLFTGKRVKPRDVILALFVFLGLSIVVPTYELSNTAVQGLLWGLASAVTFALLTLLNRHLVQNTPSTAIGFGQNLWAAVCLLPFYEPLMTLDAIGWSQVIALGLFCTAIAHTLFIAALRTVRPHLASVSTGLEPVYGIVIALVVLGERPSLRVLLGGALIVAVVIIASWLEGGEEPEALRVPPRGS